MVRRLAAAMAGLCAVVCVGSASAADTADTTVVWNPFTHQTQARPESFPLAQDGSVGLTKLKWVRWGTSTASGIGVNSYRLGPGSKFAHTSATIQLTRRTFCHGRFYYAHAVATVTSLKAGATTPHTSAETFSLLPSDCAPNRG